MDCNNMYIEPDKYTLRPTVFYTILSQLHLILLMVISGLVHGLIGVPEYFGEIAMVGFFLVFTYRVIYLQSFVYTFEADQILIRYGVFSLTKEYVELFRVKDFNTHQSLIMRLIGVMRVNIFTSDITQKVIQIKGVPNSDFLLALRRLVLQSRKNNSVFEVD